MTTSGGLPPAGSVAFTVLRAPLADPGLRVLMGPADGAVHVVVRGLPDGSNGVEVCPVEGVAGSPGGGACVVAMADRAVDLGLGGGSAGSPDGGLRGVLLRPLTGAPATAGRLAEVTFTYRPGGDSLTVVTPPVPASGGDDDVSLALVPTAPGTFELVADGRHGKPQLTLRSGRDRAGSSRVVSSVGGGGRLHIRATVEGPEGVTLTLRNQGSAELPPLELALVWPARR